MPTVRRVTFGRIPPPPQSYATLADAQVLADAATVGMTYMRTPMDVCTVTEDAQFQLTKQAAATQRVTGVYARGGGAPATQRVTGIYGVGSGIAGPTRDDLVYDAYRPTVDVAGVSNWQLLSEYNSPSVNSFSWTTGGTAANPLVVRNKVIYGVVIRAASYVTFINCLFLGPGIRPGNETALLQVYDNTYKGWVILDCTLAPRRPSANLDGVKGNNFKAFRCHLIWVVDGFGVFTNSGTAATNVEIAGCLVEALTYFPGPQYANANNSRLRTDGSYGTSGTFVLRSDNAPASEMAEIDSVHTDGNHNDGIEIQGGYGRMVRDAAPHPVTGLKRWTGDGIYVHGNHFTIYDAEHTMSDPTGSGLAVPGQAGSFAGSMLTYGDNPKRGVAQTPTMTRPVTGGQRMFNGRYAANGSAMIAVQNVNAFPYPDATYPADYTVVMTCNWLDCGNIAFNLQAKGYGALKLAMLNNKIGPNIYRNGSNPTGNPQIYPIRVDSQSKLQLAPADDGSPGLASNVWDDPQNRWGRNGLALYWVTPQVGSDATHTTQWAGTGRYWTSTEAQTVRTSGVWYDAV